MALAITRTRARGDDPLALARAPRPALRAPVADAGQRRLGRGQDEGHYLQAQFQRLRARRRAKKAIIAVAASMLTAGCHILRDSLPYKDLGTGYFTRRDTKHAARRLQRPLEDLAPLSKSSNDRWGFNVAAGLHVEAGTSRVRGCSVCTEG